MTRTHNFSVWRSPIDEGWNLWARCHCGFECTARNYEDLTVLTNDHRDDQRRLAALEAEEARK
jgi:hypothetical protein